MEILKNYENQIELEGNKVIFKNDSPIFLDEYQNIYDELVNEDYGAYTYSVELESKSFTDDYFNGSYQECLDFCKERNIVLGKDARIALIKLDRNMCNIYTEEIYFDIDN